MAYIENPFSVGQEVLCINDNFPQVITTSSDKSRIGVQPHKHPVVGYAYRIDEILGEFIRIEMFDENNPEHPDYGWRWWKHTHFSAVKNGVEKLQEKEIELLRIF